MTQLNAQTIMTDKLYEDAFETTQSVEKGNVQLTRAKERNRTTVKLLLTFLIVMTMTLLFLDAWAS
jgi:syntaxin 18